MVLSYPESPNSCELCGSPVQHEKVNVQGEERDYYYCLDEEEFGHIMKN
jgi:hypothetical protein